MPRGPTEQTPSWDKLGSDLRKPVQQLASGNAKDGLPALLGVIGAFIGNSLGIVGLGTGVTAVSTFVSGLVVDSAVKRMAEENERLDDEQARQDALVGCLIGRLKELARGGELGLQGFEQEIRALLRVQHDHLEQMIAEHQRTRRFVAEAVREDGAETRAAVANAERTVLGAVRGELDASQRAELLDGYLAHVQTAHGRLRGIFKHRDTEGLYVELAIDDCSDGTKGSSSASRGRLALGGHRELTLHDLMEGAFAANPEAAARWVVLGDPGAGKSTLARRLVLDIASRFREGTSCVLPVYCPLPTLAAAGSHPFQWQEEQLAGTQSSGNGLRGLLQELADAGRVWLLLDGLDEVPDDKRDDIQVRLQQWAQGLSHVPIVVLSRPIAYDPLGEPYNGLAQVLPLDRRRQRELLEKWLDSSKAVERVLAQIDHSPGLTQACRVPLMLSLLAYLQTPEAQPNPSSTLATPKGPRSRLDLYQASIEALLKRGHAGRSGGIKSWEYARLILQRLCLFLQSHPEKQWSKRALDDALAALCAEDDQARRWLQSWNNVGEFLDEVSEVSGVLAPYDGPDAWKFLHLQFQELLTAQALRDIGGDDEIVRRARALIPEQVPRWAEVLAFGCELASDPLTVLKALAGLDAQDLALRVLPELESVDYGEALNVLGQRGWDGDYLVSLLERWLQEGGMKPDGAIGWLWRQVTEGRSTEELAYVHYALEHLARDGRARPVDRERFFRGCGRWPEGGPPESDYLEIPGGSFQMGSEHGETERLSNERLHTVSVSTFELSPTVVTNGQYEKFDSQHERELFGGRLTPQEAADHPVVNVSWWGAYLYACWVGAELPTEAQWEYACRSGTSTPFSFGETITPKQVNYHGIFLYAGADRGEFREATVVAGSLPSNGWGLHEMHGNVWEWCQDWYGDYDDASTPDPSGPARGTGRVQRGGSWRLHADRARSAQRDRNVPGNRYRDIGFRVSRGQAQAGPPRDAVAQGKGVEPPDAATWERRG